MLKQLVRGTIPSSADYFKLGVSIFILKINCYLCLLKSTPVVATIGVNST